MRSVHDFFLYIPPHMHSNYQQRKANDVLNADQDVRAIELLRFLVSCKQAYNQSKSASALRMRFEDSVVEHTQAPTRNLFFDSMFQSSTYKTFQGQLNAMRKVGNGSVNLGKNSAKLEKLREVCKVLCCQFCEVVTYQPIVGVETVWGFCLCVDVS